MPGKTTISRLLDKVALSTLLAQAILTVMVLGLGFAIGSQIGHLP